MNLYTAKPIVVEAMQVTGEPEMDRELDAWLRKELTWFDANVWQWPENGFGRDDEIWVIMTERRMSQAMTGDWIVKIGEKDWQTCRDDEFRARYNSMNAVERGAYYATDHNLVG